MDIISVTHAKPLADYKLSIEFSDGAEGVVDLKDFIFSDKRPVVTALRDPNEFAALRVDLDTVVWPNGFDLAPEFLYSKKKSCIAL